TRIVIDHQLTILIFLYPGFDSLGFVPHYYDSAVVLYGESFVKQQGTLPWATLITYDSLVAAFARPDFDKAVLLAADLSHYVADGHMPLHLTANYNGQLTGNKGIHSRYESSMINRYIAQIQFDSVEIELLTDVRDYVFNYMYKCYPYVDSILIADNYAKTIDANTSSSAYLSAMWDTTEHFTNKLFNDASVAFSTMFYNAWHEAGSPDLTVHTFAAEIIKNEFSLQNVYFNGNDSLLNLQFSIDQPMLLQFSIVDLAGKLYFTFEKEEQSSGIYEEVFPGLHLPVGVYVLTMNAEGKSISERFVVRN
ncbi:MAG TPA: T9SS type A sorting domain-containing protein, partial [Prolixibacteraceae bacterium]|nr:T9SS type A sorting domain-containing protein [Prolixibacteraceae bacterium]